MTNPSFCACRSRWFVCVYAVPARRTTTTTVIYYTGVGTTVSVEGGRDGRREYIIIIFSKPLAISSLFSLFPSAAAAAIIHVYSPGTARSVGITIIVIRPTKPTPNPPRPNRRSFRSIRFCQFWGPWAISKSPFAHGIKPDINTIRNPTSIQSRTDMKTKNSKRQVTTYGFEWYFLMWTIGANREALDIVAARV